MWWRPSRAPSPDQPRSAESHSVNPGISGTPGYPFGARIDGWYPSLKRTPAQIFARQQGNVQGAWEVMADLSRWTVARRIHSTRQVNELMVDFWSNLLHVPLGSDQGQFWRVSYDQMIRRYALTSFEDLLLHATTHPAMGLNLNNAVSTNDAPNENLGRELLELHTVGLSSTEDDVKSSAHILTGYRVDVWWPAFASYYDPKAHWTGPINMLGFRSANSSPDGRAVTTAYLKYLAHHPQTAQKIARRLGVEFVHDNPSRSLVAGALASAKGAPEQVAAILQKFSLAPGDLAGLKARAVTDVANSYAQVFVVATILVACCLIPAFFLPRRKLAPVDPLVSH